MGLNKFIRSLDIFGYPVVLNFVQNGGFRGTVNGGLISVVLELFLTGVLILKSKEFILNENDSVSFGTSRINFGDVGEISL